jgi:hypothetical protein
MVHHNHTKILLYSILLDERRTQLHPSHATRQKTLQRSGIYLGNSTCVNPNWLPMLAHSLINRYSIEALSQHDIIRAITLIPQARLANPAVADVLKEFVLHNSEASALFSIIQPSFLHLTEDMLKEFLCKRELSDLDEDVLFQRVMDWAVHRVCCDVVPMHRIAGETLYLIEYFRRGHVPIYSAHRYGTVDLAGRVAIPASLIRRHISPLLGFIRFEHVSQELVNKLSSQALINDREIRRVSPRPPRMLRHDFVMSDRLSPTSFGYANGVWCVDMNIQNDQLSLFISHQASTQIDSVITLKLPNEHISARIAWQSGVHRHFLHSLPRSHPCVNASLYIHIDDTANHKRFIDNSIQELQCSEHALSLINFSHNCMIPSQELLSVDNRDTQEQILGKRKLDDMYRESLHLDRLFFEDTHFGVWLRDKKIKWADQRKNRRHEPEKERYCLCRAEWDDNDTDMIQCDLCHVWYHFACLGMDPTESENIETYLCPLCQRKNKSPTPHEKHKKWSQEQDQKLLSLCTKKANKNWPNIAHVLGRTPKQCRDRWMDHVDPSINRSEWTVEEDRLILKLKGEMGTAWCKMTDHIKGRSANMIRNRYRSIVNGREKKKES